ncbi:MAG: hypothetical protein ACP5MG_03050 [Verrucomicrobiia bacterium]|jgi:hypothetical protein
MMKPWILAVLLGLGYGLPQIYGIKNPEAYKNLARKFPRSLPVGYFLMLLGTFWFIYNVSLERVADFENMKNYLYVLFLGIGIGACIFVKDFLAVRGFAVVLLLLAKLIVDTFRWVESSWRLVVVVWAYIMVVAGIWFTISPWKMRNWIEWTTETPNRTKIICAIRLAFGLFVALLGIAAFR